MPAVLVHGVPDTHHVWDDVMQHVDRTDVQTLDLPGFGNDRPDSFDASKEAYVDWIITQLEAFGEPVDLVGHDWGCILTARVASLRPDLVRTWAGGNGPVSSRYEWHPLAKSWQDPVEGDRFIAEFDAMGFEDALVSFDAPRAAVHSAVARVDATMRDSIVRLYRSAVTVGQEWEPGLADVTAPALVFWGRKDPAVPVAFAHDLGSHIADARVIELETNHWTILESPDVVAALLQQHWDQAAS